MFKSIPVNTPTNPYSILVGHQWIERLPDFLPDKKASSSLFLISDKKVFSLYGETVLEICSRAGFKIKAAVLPGGEENKNLPWIAWLYEQMIQAGIDRYSTVLALGGGIVGDMAGFAAATYMRGIAYLQIPTTLLAQVDSSIGGKTGINLPQGNNLVGAFHQPRLVFIDTDFLKTLPEKEYLTGLAEVIKYGIMGDKEFFSFLEKKQPEISRRHPRALQAIIARSAEIKAAIVTRDEKELGLRALLNLGHTFGHALETLTAYKGFTHGEAVAIGIAYAARLANQLHLLGAEDCARIIALLQKYQLPIAYGGLKPDNIINQMYKDKKNRSGRLKLILPVAIGQCQIISDVSAQDILSILH